MKNKKVIGGMLLIIFGIALIVLANNKSFAISNNNVKVNMGITCDKTVLKPGEQTNCTLSCQLTNMTTTALYSDMVTLSDNLEMVSINKAEPWQGHNINYNENPNVVDQKDKDFQFYSADENSNFNIATFTVKAKSTATTITDEQIKFNNIKLYKTDSKDYVNAATARNITIKPDGVEEYEDDVVGSSANLSRIEIIGQNDSYSLESEIAPTTIEFYVSSETKTVDIDATLSDVTSSFVAGYGPRTIDVTKQSTAEIKVQNTKGEVSTYTIKINREAGATATTPTNNTNNTTNNSTNKKVVTPQGSSDTGEVVTVPDTAAFSSKAILILGILVLVIGMGLVLIGIIKNKTSEGK